MRQCLLPYLSVSVGLGEPGTGSVPALEESRFTPVSKELPAPLSGSVSISGIAEGVTGMLGIGMAGSVTSGHGEEATFPRSDISPQAHKSKLSARPRTRYTKSLFIFILLLLFTELLFTGEERIIHRENAGMNCYLLRDVVFFAYGNNKKKSNIARQN